MQFKCFVLNDDNILRKIKDTGIKKIFLFQHLLETCTTYVAEVWMKGAEIINRL